MAIKSFDAAFDFFPGNKTDPNRASVLAVVVKFFAAISEGIDAQARYRQLTANGVEPGAAARRSFEQSFETG